MPCARNSAPPIFSRFGLEHVDEQFADGLALLLRVVDAVERFEENLGRVHVHQRNIVAAAKQRHDLLGFAEPQQPVIDEHASELIADRFVQQHRGDRGIDAAGEPADHPALADLAADLLDRLELERPHGPVAGAARDLAHEIAQQRRAMRRVHDFEMELGGVEFALVVGDHGDRRVGGGADDIEAFRQRRDAVAVAHPHRIFLADFPDAVEQRAGRRHLDLGAAEFAMMAGLDLAAELVPPWPVRRSRCRAPARPTDRSPSARAARPGRARRPGRRRG